nr:hypothetical protein [uncultured Draconibacterium sp.]
MTNRIQQEIEKTDWNDRDSVIEFYEKNTVYFDNCNVIKDLDLLIEIADIKLSYLLALEFKKHYSKADKNLEDCGNLIEKLKSTESYDRLNERFLFSSGIIAQRLNRFEESQTNFEKLVKIDPDNDLYKKWYESNKDHLIYKKSKIIGYIGAGIFLLCMFSETLIKIENDLKLRLELLGFIMMALGFYGYRLRKIILKWKKNGL